MQVVAAFCIHVIGKAEVHQIGNLGQIAFQVDGTNAAVQGTALKAHGFNFTPRRLPLFGLFDTGFCYRYNQIRSVKCLITRFSSRMS